MICPNCGEKGAVALRESGGFADVYCNICGAESSLPIWGARIREPHKDYTGPVWAEKTEAHAMKVEYNGFTGELREIKAADIYVFGGTEKIYRLSIFIEEKQATVTFDNVELKDVKFLGGAVSFA